MQFFDTNFLYTGIGAVPSSSSGTASLAFNEDDRFVWTSIGQGTNGNNITLSCTLSSPQIIDTIVIKNTNISNLTFTVFGTPPPVFGTLLVRNVNNLLTIVIPITNVSTVNSITINGSNTIIANQEKTVAKVYGFKSLGRIRNTDDVRATKNRLQKINRLYVGKVDIINKGSYYDFDVILRDHYVPNDNAIISLLRSRLSPFWFWINDNDQAAMVMDQEPYRFQDFYKVAITERDNFKFNDNKFFGGIDGVLNMVEVV